MLSSSPDTLGLYFCLLVSSITDFDRKGMLLYKHPWDSVLNLEMLTLTRPETENMEENKIGVNSLHISKSFVITKEGWKQFLSRRKRQQKATPSIQYSGSSIQHWSRMDPEPAARRPAPGLHGICLGNGKNQKTGQGELQVAHPEASIYKQDIVCPKASCKWEYSEAGCSKRSLAPSPSRHLEKLTICSAQNEERLLGMEEARNSEGDSAVFNLCYLQWMLFSLWPGLPPHLAHPPPLWHLTANRKKNKTETRSFELPWTKSNGKLPLHCSDWKTPWGCRQGCQKQTVALRRYFQGESRLQRVSRHQTVFETGCLTQTMIVFTRIAFSSWFHHSSKDAKRMTKIGK